MSDIVSNLMAIKAKIPAAAEAAVAAVQEQIFEDSQGLVPVDKGTLKGTGKRHSPASSGGSTTGIISYGSGETLTDWHGVGYEVLVHTPGTKFYGGVPYLEQPTMDAKGYAANIAAEVMGKALSS